MASDLGELGDPTSLSVYRDLERPPLAVTPLRRALLRDGGRWTSVDVRDEVDSTNAELVRAARAGTAGPGAVLVAEVQSAGRGRLDRVWVSPSRSGLTFSVLLAPAVPITRWGWLPLLAGLAVCDGVERATGVDAGVKWPNDVLSPDGRKLAGLLAERIDVQGVPLAVLGVGLNVSMRTEELPVPTASSVALAGGEPLDRQTVLVSILRELAERLKELEDGSDPADAYRDRCVTLGQRVRVEQPAREPLIGVASDVDDQGRLVVDGPGGTRTAVAAADVIHLR